ncbi:MAG: ribosome assembly cofactor RimP [Bacteroidales bacterium]|jgi:ribosome maturation factor RimP|nr:ribosome assembly cofactor RimP [Bacteroidales bacterium]
MGYITVNFITELVNKKIAETDLFIGDIKVKGGNIIYVFLDGDNSVTIDQCADISRYIEHHLDRAKEDFELHVSSYGVGQPLKFFRQYKNAIGKTLSVTTEEGIKYIGKLVYVDEGKLILEKLGLKKKQQEIKVEISFPTVKMAKIEVVFNHE